ncbi:MAG: carbohydrate kinase [Lachnospiraceae bacterium]
MKQNKKLYAIGEALIDFIPQTKGCPIKEVTEFCPVVGGAPANVCGAFRILGGEAEMITQLGTDPFADKIIGEFEKYGIGTSHVLKTEKANTSLAFVALREDGNREFSFYRNPGADMLLEADQIQEEWFEDIYALHFCSVSLGDFPMKDAHEKAIEYAKKQGAIISFDPNIRLPLWKDPEILKRRILEFMPKADVLKISDEELEFITGSQEIEKALKSLFVGDVKLVIYTMGSDGARAFTKNANAFAESVRVKAVDTTGAGDGFIGSFLYQLYEDGISLPGLEELSEASMEKYLKFSNRFCSISVMGQGAIASYPTKDECQ